MRLLEDAKPKATSGVVGRKTQCFMTLLFNVKV